MEQFKSPMGVEEICEAIRGVLNKLEGVYYSKHRSWLYFVKLEDADLDDYKKMQKECSDARKNIKKLPKDGIATNAAYREMARNHLPFCVAHNSHEKFDEIFKFFEALSKKGEINGPQKGDMALRRLAEIYMDLAGNDWTTSNVLTKSLEQLFSYSYGLSFGRLLCCALMSGWYVEVINIILPRIYWLGKESIGEINIIENDQYKGHQREFRLLEFVAKWFDECAVNMLKCNDYYIFKCEEDENLFFNTVTNDPTSKVTNEQSSGKRYALMAAFFYQLDYALNTDQFKPDSELLACFLWRTARCYANAARTKEAVYFIEKARQCSRPLKKKLMFYRDRMNIYYQNERYDEIVSPSKSFERNIPENRRTIVSVSEYRFTSDLNKHNWNIAISENSKETDLTKTIERINEFITKTTQGEVIKNAETAKNIIAVLYARAMFLKDENKRCKNEFENPEENNVRLFLNAMILLKSAINAELESATNLTLLPENKEKILNSWSAMKEIKETEKFLSRSKFAIENLKDIDGEGNDFQEEICKILLFVYMTFRLQDILSVSIKDIGKMGKLCFYTTISNLNHWLDSSTYRGCPLTMSHVNYFNDPLEGNLFNDNSDKNDAPPKVFLKSFTFKYDDFPMWDRYADDGKGVSIILDCPFLGRFLEDLRCTNDSEIIAARIEDSSNIYRVVYYTKEGDGKLTINDVTMSEKEKEKEGSEFHEKMKEKIQNLVECMRKTRSEFREERAKSRTRKKRHTQDIFEKILNYYTERIAYLFKLDIYQSEQELRVISYNYDKVKTLPADPLPKLAVQWSNTVSFAEIMFGPRMTDGTIHSITPYIQKHIDHINRWKEKDNFKFTRSKIKAQ